MKSYKVVPGFALALTLCLPAAWAQNSQPQNQPPSQGATMPLQPASAQPITDGNQGAVPAARGLFVGYNPQDQGASQQQPDTHLLSGVESFGLGTLQSLTTLFDPSVFVSESADTGIVAGQLNTLTSVGGALMMNRNWSELRFAMQYHGAQSFYRPGSAYDGSFHDLGLVQTATFGRWNLLLRDDFLYSQASSFGGLDIGSVIATNSSGVLSNLQPGYAPDETIATGRLGRLNNTLVGQASYSLTRRTAVTFSASYGLLTFTAPGYVDSHSAGATVGYNYALTANNSIAATYSYSQTAYGSSGNTFDHILQAAYGRKIIGHVALQLAAGPQVIYFRNVIGAPSTPRVSWSANGALNYGLRFHHTIYSLAYSHATSSGSGVFYGADTDALTVSAHYTIARRWLASVAGGYARNKSLVIVSTAASQYNDWFTGVNLNRQFGEHLNMITAYQFQQQLSNGGCPVLSCGVTPTRHAVSVTFEWHPWPIRLQ